jgi:hypothetical protein
MKKPRRNGAHAVALKHYPVRCCAICRIEGDAIELAHLDHNRANNEPDNLVYLCRNHHWDVDGGLYPIAIVKTLRDHWQTKPIYNRRGVWKADLSEAARRAHTTMRARKKAKARSGAARRAHATRRARKEAKGVHPV